MATSQVYTCDICSKQKGETNHWYMVLVSDVHIRITVWNDRSVDCEELKHICGQECLTKFISQQAPKLKKSGV